MRAAAVSRGPLRGRSHAAWLAVDVAALACGLASLALLGLRAVWLHLGMIPPGAMVAGVLPPLVACGLVLAWVSRLRAVRAGLRERADRRILLTAASVLLFSGYVTAVLALAVVGRHARDLAGPHAMPGSLPGSLLEAQREVAVALPLLALAGLALLAWQLRPVARRLQQSEARLRSAIEESGLGVLMFGRSGRIVLANAAIADMLGYSERELLAMDSVLDLVHPQERASAATAAFAQRDWASYCAQRRYRRRDGSYLSVRLHVSPVREQAGIDDMAVAFVQDVSAWLAGADAFRREHAFLRAVLGQMREGVVAVDEFGRLRYVNHAACAQLGYAPDGIAAADTWRHRAVLHDPDMRPLDDASHPLRRALEGQGTAHGEVLCVLGGSTLRLQLSSEPLRDDLGSSIGAVLVTHDVTESSDSRRRLMWLACHDPLTSLPNRHRLVERLRAGVERIARDGGMLAVLFIDLDRFKTVNESLGHELGDRLLIEVSSRLLGMLGPKDTLARLGGDDFVVVLDPLDDAAAAARAAERLLGALAQPVRLAGHVVYTGATAGIALCPGDGDDVELLLRRADAAMFQAKQSAPGSWRYFGETDARTVEQHLELEGALRAAVGERAFELRFQPKVDVSNAALVGAEALLRWTRPGHGEVPPGVFIPLLEDMGLISAVGEWVLEAVCAQQARWSGRGLRVVPVAVNCSARQFQGRSLVELVASALHRHRIPGALLQIELTESVLMQGSEAVAELLEGLRRLGVESSIDDFGTGYSSLAYLKRLPVRSLKIDREFIRSLPADQGDAAIVDAILALARALRLTVVAEGVERAEQLAFLRERGCDQYQGYWFRPPLPAEDFERLLTHAELEAR